MGEETLYALTQHCPSCWRSSQPSRPTLSSGASQAAPAPRQEAGGGRPLPLPPGPPTHPASHLLLRPQEAAGFQMAAWPAAGQEQRKGQAKGRGQRAKGGRAVTKPTPAHGWEGPFLGLFTWGTSLRGGLCLREISGASEVRATTASLHGFQVPLSLGQAEGRLA